MLDKSQKEQLSSILFSLGEELDISRDQHDKAVTSYEFAGEWLARKDSALAAYKPEISPQGSFLLGTMIRPVNEDDDLDFDLVCRFAWKPAGWTQQQLKKAVGDRLKLHGTFARMLQEEGRRCWTLDHAEEAQFHLDILPAVVSGGFEQLVNSNITTDELQRAAGLAIRITDNKLNNYPTEPNMERWLRSNPFGYAIWFRSRAALLQQRVFSLKEAVRPVPEYQAKKLPLQIAVQLMKRHRDIRFDGDKDKPISIIITTLAAIVYNKEPDVFATLQAVIPNLRHAIETRYNPVTGKNEEWVANPVNPEENFADKWQTHPKRRANFYNWLAQLEKDFAMLQQQRGAPLLESIKGQFGQREAAKVFGRLGDGLLQLREQGKLRMADGTGMLGLTGRGLIQPHTNFGSHE